MWDPEAVLNDLRKLAKRQRAIDALTECGTLLALGPINEVAEGQLPNVRADVLRRFLAAVVAHASPDDKHAMAGALLIGVGLPSGLGVGGRQDAAAQRLAGEDRRTIRRNRDLYLRALGRAILDFIDDPDSAERFAKSERAALRSRAHGSPTSGSVESSAPAEPDKRRRYPADPPADFASLLQGLIDAGKADPVAAGLLARLDPDDLDGQFLERLSALYKLGSHSQGLGKRLLELAQARRAWRAMPDDATRSLDSLEHAKYSLIDSDLILLHSSISIFMIREGYRWIAGGSDVELRARQSLRTIYRSVPFEIGDGDWLSELLAQPQPGEEVDSIMRGRNMPDLPEDREPHWRRLAEACECDRDEAPQDGCAAHVLVQACERLAEEVRALATQRLANG